MIDDGSFAYCLTAVHNHTLYIADPHIINKSTVTPFYSVTLDQEGA